MQNAGAFLLGLAVWYNECVKNQKIPDNQITFYQSQDGLVNIEVMFSEENIWLSQKRMAELFDTTVPNVNMHLKNIFENKELGDDSVIKDFLITATDGKISHEVAIALAESEYEKYRKGQDKNYISDFDKEVKKLLKKKK